ncbi:MAG: hypothetical protein LAP86_17385 [Acidobacteriia bacterium]|nr:hypothetical protein [Terriglobia bacterium]
MPTPPPTPPPPAAPSGPTINIGEEFGTAKKSLPSGKILVIAIIVLGIVVAFVSFLKRAKPQASGTLDNVVAVQIPGQDSTMVALTFTLHNSSDKTLYVHTLQASVKAPNVPDSTVDAVSAVDFDRYFQAFPTLKNGSQPALTPETKIQPGETTARTIIVAFPMNLDAFNRRQVLAAVIWPYDQTVPVVLSK